MGLNELIKNFNGLSKEDIISSLRMRQDLSSDMKNLILLYHYPRPLLDRELPERIKKVLGNDNSVTVLIVEAFRTEQYGRFIRHLFHSFLENENMNKIYPVSIPEKDSICPICGRPFSTHEKGTLVAYGCPDSKILLCLSCLGNLKRAYDILDIIDPGFLGRYSKQY